MQRSKPILLTHDLHDGSTIQRDVVIMRWDGLEMPKVLRTLSPGQYALIPFNPSDDACASTKEAA
jgi:hypothetical protein